MKFWGNVAHLQPGHILSHYPTLVTSLMMMVQSDDDTLKSVAFETIGYIGVRFVGNYCIELSSTKIVSNKVDNLGG